MQVFAFRLQQVMLGNTVTKVLGVFLLGLPMILAGGLLYAAVSGRSLLQGLISAYGGLYKIPGKENQVDLPALFIAPGQQLSSTGLDFKNLFNQVLLMCCSSLRLSLKGCVQFCMLPFPCPFSYAISKLGYLKT